MQYYDDSMKPYARWEYPLHLNLLETFRAVIEQKSTQAAAKTLGITQSAVSRRIAQLEDELKLELFRRDKGRLIPTRDCQALQGNIFGMVDRGQHLQQLAQDLQHGNSPAIRLRIAVPASLTLSIMPRIIRQFLEQNDRVQIELHSGPYDTIERMLLDDRAELGFLRIPAQREGLHVMPAIETHTVCVMPDAHPLTQKKVITMADLRGQPLILLGRMRAPRRELDEAFWTAGLTPNARVEAHSVLSACSMVAEGLGLTLVNALMARDFAHLGLTTRPLYPLLSHRFAFAASAELPMSQAAENFVRLGSAVLDSLR
jgi:DNA-binding transcriptional LysR family regulator